MKTHVRFGLNRILLATIATAIALLLAIVVVQRSSRHSSASEPAARAAPNGTFRPTPDQWAALRVAPVATLPFRTEQLTDGKIAIDGNRTTPVFSPYSGRVTKIIASPGDQVKQGDPLFALQATEFSQAQNDLKSAAAALSVAKSQLGLAETVEARKRALYEAKAGALQDWQQSQADLASSRNAVRAAQATFDAVRNRLRILGKTDDQINALEQAPGVDPAAVVVAPIDGVVVDRQVGLGQYLQSGAANPVYAIADLSVVWLVANVRESDAPRMHRGAHVEVHVLAFPDRVFKANLTYIAPSVDPVTHRLPVRAEVDNADRALKPEMFARFSIITDAGTVAPAVPETAIVYEGEAARVWIAQGDVLASREIRVGRITGGMAEVVAGLQAGEKIVTSGSLFIDRAARAD